MTPTVPPRRILVTASRDWAEQHPADRELAFRVLGIVVLAARTDNSKMRREVIIVHGAARGGDRLADKIARQLGATPDPHPVTSADWDAYPRVAGHRRNRRMVAAGADLCVGLALRCTEPRCAGRAAHYTHGTHSAMRMARQAGIPVLRVSRRTVHATRLPSWLAAPEALGALAACVPGGWLEEAPAACA